MDYTTLVHTIVDPFLANPDAILVREIKEEETENDVSLLVVAENGDIARLIGKKGCVANAVRYKKGSHLFIKDKNGNYIDLVVNTFYSKGENLDVISFMDHDTIESVEPLLNHELFALKDDSILFDNEYFYDDLLNLTVFDEDNNELGVVSSIEEFPSQITLKVSKKDKHFFYVPFNDFFIKDVNLEDKKLIIHVIEGLIE